MVYVYNVTLACSSTPTLRLENSMEFNSDKIETKGES